MPTANAPRSRGRLLLAPALVAFGIALGIALQPGGGAARTASGDPIQAFLAAVRRPSSGQFPTPQAAVPLPGGALSG